MSPWQSPLAGDILAVEPPCKEVMPNNHEWHPLLADMAWFLLYISSEIVGTPARQSPYKDSQPWGCPCFFQ